MKSHKIVGIKGFLTYYFSMMIEGSGSGSRAGSGYMPLTSASGSGRPKNVWIRWVRIRIRIRIRNTASFHRQKGKRWQSFNRKTAHVETSVETSNPFKMYVCTVTVRYRYILFWLSVTDEFDENV
jgi:hypothetical protein